MASDHAGHRERFRQRLLEKGAVDFAPYELLEFLLFYAIPRRDVNPLAHRMINHFGTLSNVLQAPLEELRTVEGLGDNAAMFFVLLSQLNSLILAERTTVRLSTPDEIGEFFMNQFHGEHHEVVRLLCVDGRGKYLSCHRVGEGGLRSAMVNVRKAAEVAIRTNAAIVYLAHNHPSGELLLSREDYNATLRVRSALKTVGVELRDHYIITDRDYLSMRENGFQDAFRDSVRDW